MKIDAMHGLIAMGVAVAMFAAVAPAVSADEVIKVTLTDKGTEVEQARGLGFAMGGDMAKATMATVAEPASVKAGKVTIEVTNNSKETMHEVIIAPVNNPSHALPYEEDSERVNEEAAGDLGEVADLEPGKSGAITLDLKPGTYLLYCNIPGHYMAGMWTTVTVTP